MNIRSPHAQTASDFDLKSPELARARKTAQTGTEADYAQNVLSESFESSHAEDNKADDDNGADSHGADDSSHADDSHGDEDHIEEDEIFLQQSSEISPSRGFDLTQDEETEDFEAGEIQIPRAEYRPREEPLRAEREEDYAEFELVFAQWKETGDPRLRERLILMNRSMVMFLARRFMDRGELFEDVLQVGMLGLIYALDGYDVNRGVKFSTFAIPTISGEIRRYFRDKVSGMRVPRGLQELHSRLQVRIEELTQQLDRSPTYAEIAFSLKIEVEQVVEAMELGSAIDPLSIDDRFYGEESATIAESIGAPDPQLHAYEEHAALQAALERLPAQERRVLEMNYFEGHSQAEIARRLNVSQMHISRLLRRSLGQLKELLEDS